MPLTLFSFPFQVEHIQFERARDSLLKMGDSHESTQGAAKPWVSIFSNEAIAELRKLQDDYKAQALISAENTSSDSLALPSTSMHRKLQRKLCHLCPRGHREVSNPFVDFIWLIMDGFA